jgi:hypothetical protein
MEPTPFHEGLWASVGGRFLTSGQYLPCHPVAQRWAMASRALRAGGWYARSQWRVRAGFSPDFP